MNRVLSLPITHITAEQLELLQAERHNVLVGEHGTIKLRHRNGLVELKFLQPEDYLLPETPVCVWWKGGGFVCASQAELDFEAQEVQSVAKRVAQARSTLAAARNERTVRQAAKESTRVEVPQLTDVVVPETIFTY